MIINNSVSNSRVKSVLIKTAKYIFLLFLLIYNALPVLWTFSSSLKSNGEIFTTHRFLPKVITLLNYKTALFSDMLLSSFRNSIANAVFATCFTILVAAMAAYALSYKFRLKKIVYNYLTFGIFMPTLAFMVPYLFLAYRTKIFDTILVLILTNLAFGLPLAVIILKGYIDTIPRELSEAAVIDGCGFLQIFGRVIFPLAIPGMSVIGVYTFIATWNEFFYSMILTRGTKMATLPLGVRQFVTDYSTDYGAMFAYVMLVTMPALIAYIFFQKHIIAGLTSGALKG